MKRIGLVIVCVLAFGLADCTHTSYRIADRKFRDFDEALAYSNALENNLIKELPPLPASIGGPAILIYPTRAQWEEDTRRNYPFASEKEVRNFVEMGIRNKTVLRTIERRNIFQSVRYIEAESPEGTPVPPGGYLLWYEIKDIGRATGTDLHMIASGEIELTLIDEYVDRPTDDLEAGKANMMRELQMIEDYVKAHPATE